MIHESKYLRIWKASDDLMSLLPNPRRVPTHQGYDNSISTATKHGLEYVTCVLGDWHNDWPEIFEYLVVRGSAELYIGEEPCSKREAQLAPIKFTKHHLERGYCIQLWPMVPHRVGMIGSMSLLSGVVDPWGKGNPEYPFEGFGSPISLEFYFKKLIFENYIIKRKSKKS